MWDPHVLTVGSSALSASIEETHWHYTNFSIREQNMSLDININQVRRTLNDTKSIIPHLNFRRNVFVVSTFTGIENVPRG